MPRSASQMQFTYYDADSVSIVATINPSGGPRFGGTMVRFGAASNVADYQGAVWEAVGVGTVNTTDVLTPISGRGCRFGASTAFVRAMMTNQEGWARRRIVRGPSLTLFGHRLDASPSATLLAATTDATASATAVTASAVSTSLSAVSTL